MGCWVDQNTQVTTTITKTHAFLGECYIVAVTEMLLKIELRKEMQLELGHRSLQR